ncbi:MAG: phosphatase [Candidatus Riflebacteria bacterium]
MIAEEMKKCYWLVENQILAGPYPYNPGAKQPALFLDNLNAAGIDSFIDLTEEDELTHYDSLLPKTACYRRFAIEDFSVPTVLQMRLIQKHLQSEIAAGRKVYIHCFGGIGRTGTVAGCYLAENGFPGILALEELARRFSSSSSSAWAHSPETPEQKEMVEHWPPDVQYSVTSD